MHDSLEKISPSVKKCCEHNIVAKAKIDLRQALDANVWKSANQNRGHWISVPLIRSGSRAAAADRFVDRHVLKFRSCFVIGSHLMPQSSTYLLMIVTKRLCVRNVHLRLPARVLP